MSTTPAPVAQVTTSVASTSIVKDISGYVKLHEKLILTLVIVVALIFGVNRGLSYLASRDQLVANKATVVLQAQVDANTKAAADAKQTLAQYAQLVQQLAASNTSIAASQQQRTTATVAQQAADKSLPPSSLAARWTTLAGASPDAVQPAQQGFTVTSDAAIQTVQQLETIPTLQQNLAGATQIEANQVKQIDAQNGVVTSLTNQVTGLQSQATDQTKACTAQVTALKAEERKSKLHWFLIGYVAGFVTRDLIPLPVK